MAKIAQNVGDVHVLHPETNQPVVLHPGDSVPSALRELVGDHALEQDEVAADITEAPAAGPAQTATLDSETLVAIAKARQAEAERTEEAERAEETKQAEADEAAAKEKAAKAAEPKKAAAAKKADS